MSLEDQAHFHEQWLRSIDSNLDRVTGHLAATDAALAVVAQNQSNFAASMVGLAHRMDELAGRMNTLAGRMDALTARMDTLAEQHRRMEEAFEQYLRFRSNGGPKN